MVMSIVGYLAALRDYKIHSEGHSIDSLTGKVIQGSINVYMNANTNWSPRLDSWKSHNVRDSLTNMNAGF